MNINIQRVMSHLGDITLYTLTNQTGASVQLSSLGCGIVSVCVPDSQGNMQDVALGYKNLADYDNDGPCAGKVPGRYANRIAEGHLVVDGETYQLAINNGPNALHGGPTGFHNRIWDSEVVGNKVVFTRTSPDGEENYPGNLQAMVSYEWTDDDQLIMNIEATTDKATVVNLTNHCYWNLKGESAGTALDHTLYLKASHYLPTSDSLIPTGEIAPVLGTPMDFTTPKVIGEDIKQEFPALIYGKGYDNCWVIDNWTPGELKTIATLSEPTSGRILEVDSTQPAVQVYTGNWLAGCPESKSGKAYNDYDGVAIECQGMPDAPNKPQFPSQLLLPGETYKQTIVFRFKTV